MATADYHGRIAYGAYRNTSDGKSLVTGDPIPEFDALPAAIQKAWIAAGDAARNAPSPRQKGADGRVGYALRTPIQRGSETIAELRFRDLKAKDMRGFPLEGRTMGHVLDMVGKVCGQPPDVIDELGSEDLQEVSSIVGVF